MAVNTETDADNVTKRQQLEEDGEVRQRNRTGRLMHLEVFCVKEKATVVLKTVVTAITHSRVLSDILI